MRTTELRGITRQELSLCDGTQGKPIYAAFEGKVFDISSSFTWRNGYHQLFHSPGTDLTSAMAEAPHGAEILEKFPVVGILIDD